MTDKPTWDEVGPELLAVLEAALACLRHTHDRLVNLAEFETLRITINAEVRTIRAAIARAEQIGKE